MCVEIKLPQGDTCDMCAPGENNIIAEEKNSVPVFGDILFELINGKEVPEELL